MEEIHVARSGLAKELIVSNGGRIIVSDLNNSYSFCQQLARRSASNFYISFMLLPREKRRAMCALYAYLRHVDDLADDDGRDVATRRAALEELRGALDEQPAGSNIINPILPALADTVARYRIPVEYLTAVIDGVEMDLAEKEYETFEELEQYCERVASVVGLACIHIWGFHGSAALEPARRCGVAFQLTNILRDLKDDVRQRRVYLPQEDLRRFGYRLEELRRCEINSKFVELMRFEIDRTERFYGAAAELEPLLARDGRRVFCAMTATYRAVLAKIKREPEEVFRRRIRLRWWEKTRIAAGAMFVRSAPVVVDSKWETARS
jgi:phytoene synthase